MTNLKISDDLSLPDELQIANWQSQIGRCIVTIHQIAQCLALKPERVDRLGDHRHSVDVRCAKVAMAEAAERLATLESALCRSNLPNFTTEVAGVRAMLVAALESGAHPGKDGAS